MGSPAPPVPLDPVREALTRVRGEDPHDVEALIGRILTYIHFVLPDPPVSCRATLRARRPHDDVDRLSDLPVTLLRNIVSRLPGKDADRLSSPRPFPIAFDLPATLFGMSNLTRLYLGFFKFPDTAGLPRTGSFPKLRELGLCTVVIFNPDMDFVIARSPALEILCIQANMLTDRLCLVSRSLRCVQVIGGIDLDILLEYAPHLERIIVWSAWLNKCSSRRIKIAPAPALSILGYLEPEFYTLEVGSTVIKADTRASPTTMVPTVKILGLKVRVGIHNEVKLLPAFLRCFPSVERLHIESKKTTEPTGNLNLNFWKEAGAIECVQSHIKLMLFHNFHGDQSELSFLQFFLESAPMLTKLAIVYPKGTFSSMTKAKSKLEPLFSAKWASTCCSLVLFEGFYAEGKELSQFENFKRGSNFSVRDPFAVIIRA